MIKNKKVKTKPRTKNVDFDSLDWKKDSSGSQTWDFGTNPEFIGEYVRSEERKGKLKKGEKKAKPFTVNIFLDEEGNEQALPNNYQISEAIKKHGKCFYKIVFLKQTKIKGTTKVVSTFEISTANG